MALPTHVQFVSAAYNGTTVDVVMTGVVTGNTLLAGFAQAVSAVRVYSVADTASNPYTQDVELNPTIAAKIFSALNVTGGSVTVTGTFEATVGGIMGVAEVHDVATRDVVGSFDDMSTTTTSHFCADVGSIDSAANVYVFCVGSVASAGTITKGADYTRLDSGAGPIFQYRTSAAALTDDRGPYTSTTGRRGINVMASYAGAAAAGGGAIVFNLQIG